MLLKELLAGRTLPVAAANLAIRGLTSDSREVKPGYLFAALPGAKLDGARFISDAVTKGAVAVLAGDELEPDARVPVVHDANPRRALALAAATFYPRQPEKIAAVTGTSGKTSVSVFARQIWTALGEKAASIGTIGVVGPDGVRIDTGAPLTTPDPVQLHATLDRLAGEGYTRAAMEASSHGLDQYRLDGVRVAAAAFTNLTHEHLDYHGDMGAYRAAKLRLFTDLLPEGGTAIVDVDTIEGKVFAGAVEKAGRRVWRAGTKGEEIKLVEAHPSASGRRLVLDFFGARANVDLPLIGAFQASNALLAAGLVVACGGDAENAVAALSKLDGVPGRMQFVGDVRAGGGAAHVYVDYAHKPDALRAILEALRPHTVGKLWVVFGCGGDRDRAKRPIMGTIASHLADRVVLTDDNPRSETPADIRGEILTGHVDLARTEEIGGREKAIERAISELQAGDTLVIAGKGHETGQIVGDEVLPFDDVEVAARFIAKRNGEARRG